MKIMMVFLAPLFVLFSTLAIVMHKTEPSPIRTIDNLSYFMDEKTGICFASYWNETHGIYGLTAVDCSMVEGHLIDF